MNEDRNAMALNSVAHFASPQTPEKNLCGFKTSKKTKLQQENRKFRLRPWAPERCQKYKEKREACKRFNQKICV